MRYGRESQGQDIVEMALVLPLLLALLFGIVEFGVAVWRYNTVANAAREGARAGVVDDCSAGAVQDGVERLIVGLVPPPSVERNDAGGVCNVTVTYPHQLITGKFFQTFGVPATINLSASSSMIIE